MVFMFILNDNCLSCVISYAYIILVMVIILMEDNWRIIEGRLHLYSVMIWTLRTLHCDLNKAISLFILLFVLLHNLLFYILYLYWSDRNHSDSIYKQSNPTQNILQKRLIYFCFNIKYHSILKRMTFVFQFYQSNLKSNLPTESVLLDLTSVL